MSSSRHCHCAHFALYNKRRSTRHLKRIQIETGENISSINIVAFGLEWLPYCFHAPSNRHSRSKYCFKRNKMYRFICAFLLIVTAVAGELKTTLANFSLHCFIFFPIDSIVGAQNDLQLTLATLPADDDQQQEQPQQPSLSRAGPTFPSMSSLPMKPGENKATLYLGAFQVLAMPFGAGNLPGLGGAGAPTSFPGIFGSSKKE